MAFNFGANTSTPALNFGNAAKPAFGNSSFSFGSNAATTSASTGFGTFGANPATTNTGFGAFGANPAAANTGFGGFGANPATTNSGFGGFGTNPATTNAGFGGFGTNPATTNTGFGGFGTTAPAAGTAGFGGFGAPQATSSSFLGFNAPATTTSAFTGFGTNTSGMFGPQAGFGQNTGFGATNTGFGATNTGFGATNTGFGTSNTGFGGAGSTGFGNTGTGLSGFGGTGTGFGSYFGPKPLGAPANTGFGGFGTGLGAFGQQQQQQQQQAVLPHEALVNAVFNCSVFGDERDQILAKWNFLQAKWGFGKAFYANNQPPIELTEQNPLCRFKAIGYSCLPTVTDKDGLVQMVFNKTDEELKNQQAQLVTSLNAVFGNKPNLTITVDSIKGMSKNNSQAIIYVTEKSVTGMSDSRVSASAVAQFLCSPMPRQQLGTLGVSSAIAHMRPDEAQLREYLNSPPPGIDPRLWKQAQADNPNPDMFLPVPMVGFAEVKWRMQCQEEETRLHAAFLSRTSADLAQLKAKHEAALATLEDQTRRHMHLHHRLLVVIVRQESARRAGAAMTPEEEALGSRLEALHEQLTAPMQFNGRLSELLSQMRMQRCQAAGQSSERYSLDQGAQEDIKQFLSMQHTGMSHLIETVQTDLAHLAVMKEGMTRIVHGVE